MIKLEELSEMTSDVVNGEVNPLETYIELKHIEKALKSALSTVQGYAIDEAEKYGEKSFKFCGAEVGVKNAAGRWNFKNLDWYEDYQELQESAKQSFKLSLKSKQLIDDEGTVVQPAEYTEGKTTISIRLNP